MNLGQNLEQDRSLSVLNSLDDPIICTSEKGVVRFVNIAARQCPVFSGEIEGKVLSSPISLEEKNSGALEVLEQAREQSGWNGCVYLETEKKNRCFKLQVTKFAIDQDDEPHYLWKILDETLRNGFDNIVSKEQFCRLVIEKQADLVVAVDTENRFLFVSPSYCSFFDKSEKELLGQTFLPLVHEDDRQNTLDEMQKLFVPPHKCTITQRVMTSNGWRWLQWVDDAFLDAENNVTSIIGVGRDISDQVEMQNEINECKNNLEKLVDQRTAELVEANKQLQQEVIERQKKEKDFQKSQGRLQSIVTSLHGSAINVINAKGDYLEAWADEEFEKDTGIKGKDVIGQNISFYFPPEKTVELMAMIAKIINTGESVSFEYEYPTPNGMLWHEANVSLLKGYDDEEDCVVSFIKDITSRKKVEQTSLEYQKQLQSLATELTIAEERERRHIAQLLHDDIGQNLALINIRLKMLQEQIEDEKKAETLEEITGIISDTITATRSLTFDLSPPILYELGFEEALRWLLEKYCGNLGIYGSFYKQGTSPELDDNIKVLLYHVVRELLVNISKYARAKTIQLEVQNKKDLIRIKIKDDGIGFDPKKLTGHNNGFAGYGLFSIKERLRRFKGSMVIKSNPGHGTRILITVPIDIKPGNEQ